MTGRASDERPPSSSTPGSYSRHSRITPVRAWFHARPGGQALFRALVGLLGLVVVMLGLALVPLPGPGWLVVLTGVAIWAVEFVWAQHLLRYTNERLHRWNGWQRGQHWLVRIALLVTLVVMGTVTLWLSIKHGLGFDPIKHIIGAGSKHVSDLGR
jgi:uncharacterized protein (TIGR02611 family)